MSSTSTTSGCVAAWAVRKWRIAHAVSGAVADALGEPEQLRDPRRDDGPFAHALDAGLEQRPRLRRRVLVADPGQLAHDLADRPEGDPLAVGEAGAAHDPRPRPDPRDELRGEPRLAHARLADDRDQAAAPLGDDGLELALEQRELLARARRAASPPAAAPARRR